MLAVDSKAALLRQVPIFGGLREDTLAFLLERAERKRVREGEDFFREGEVGGEVYVLDRGTVEVLKGKGERTFRLMRLRAGDCFGETSLLAVMPRSASVRALEDCEAICLHNRDLYHLYEHDPEQFAILVMNMGREVARRLWVANELLFEYADFFGG
ncbi:MAG: Crp/Fnr family transcriptional regulator [Myxococcota bacterium]